MLRQIAVVSMVPTFGFLYLYATNTRKVGAETFGDPIWWHQLRLIHFILYLSFVVSAFVKPSIAYIPLLIDVIIGAFAFMNYHISR